jgi:hypothetical protein
MIINREIKRELATEGIEVKQTSGYLHVSERSHKLEISLGNNKLESWPLVNFSPATMCHGEAKGFCKVSEDCYAKHRELMTDSDVLRYRLRQFDFFRTTPKETVLRLWAAACRVLAASGYQIIRLQESGDFIAQWTVDLAADMANLAADYGITVYTYTTRKDLDYSDKGKLIVNGSGWHSDDIDGQTMVLRHGETLPKGWILCPMKCGKCMACPNGKKVAFKEHGNSKDRVAKSH